MLIDDGSWVSTQCRAIAKIAKDQADLERRLAIFTAAKLLGWYNPKSKPVAPLALQKYRAMDRSERAKFNKENPDWVTNQEVVDFTNKESAVECENMSNVWWLTNCMSKDIGSEHKDAIQRVLNLYPTHLRVKSPQRPHVDKDVEFVRITFGGIVEE